MENFEMVKNYKIYKPKIIICLFMVLMILTSTFFSSFTAFAVGNENNKLPSGTSYADIGAKIEDFVKEHEQTTAGMATSVFTKDKTIYDGYFGYTDKENNVKVNEESVIEWGSVTKLTIWVSVMQLAEQGKIDLNQDIRTYLPADYLKYLKYDKPVTMINLMCHNAGFEEVVKGLETPDENGIPSLGDALKANQPSQVFEPGTVTSYSNWSAALASYIVECVSGKPYYQYVQENIFEPLGMKDSALSPTLSDNPAVKEKREKLHYYNTKGDFISNHGAYIILYPAGMCTSTLHDLKTFAAELLNPNTKLFKNPETYKEMFTPTTFVGDTDIIKNAHGFWGIQEIKYNLLGHSGNTSGCSCNLMLDLESGVGMVVMTNQAGERTYNSKMPKLVFGDEIKNISSFDGFESGFIMSPRTILTGPMKIMSLLSMQYITAQELKQYNFSGIVTEKDGVKKIETEYGDYLILQPEQYVPMIVMAALWIAAVIFSLLSIVVKVLRFRKDTHIPLGIWSTICCILVIFSIASLVIFELDYITSICCIAIAVIAAVLIIVGIVKMKDILMTKKRIFYNILIIISMITTIGNIVFWELFMFWKL